MMKPKTKKKIKDRSAFIVKLLIGILFMLPIIIGLLFSFQTETDLVSYPLKFFTANPTLEHYISAFTTIPILHYLKNTLIVCVIAITAQIVFSSLCAYAFVFFDFKGKEFFWNVVLACMMIPGEVTIITNYVTIQNIGLVNTYPGLFITSMIGGTSIFMMRQYYKSLPKDFKDAATIDGCGELGFLFRVATPLSIPTISSLAIYLFVHIYNQFFWPLLVANDDKMRTIQVGISFLVTSDVTDYGRILAGAMVTILPSVLIYIFGQDYIIKGMTSGGVKG